MDRRSRCPRCDSPQPHLHPALQFEGEGQPCDHDYHRHITPENTAARIEQVESLKQRLAALTESENGGGDE
jgi:hypothetical protein